MTDPDRIDADVDPFPDPAGAGDSSTIEGETLGDSTEIPRKHRTPDNKNGQGLLIAAGLILLLIIIIFVGVAMSNAHDIATINANNRTQVVDTYSNVVTPSGDGPSALPAGTYNIDVSNDRASVYINIPRYSHPSYNYDGEEMYQHRPRNPSGVRGDAFRGWSGDWHDL